MKRLFIILLLSCLAVLPASAGKKKPIFFNGKDLTGWKDYRDQSLWSVKDGAIKGKSEETVIGNRFLWSSVEVKDFYLSLDVKHVPGTANAGIQFRSKRADEHGQAIGYQADIGTMGRGPKKVNIWGFLYHEHGRGKLYWTNRVEKRFNFEVWNRYEILAVGHSIWLAINGTLVAAVNEPKGELSGYIAFQIHSGVPQEVHYRIRKFQPDPEVKLAGMNEKELRKQLITVDKPMKKKRLKKKRKKR
jgi:hypothetical protein